MIDDKKRYEETEWARQAFLENEDRLECFGIDEETRQIVQGLASSITPTMQLAVSELYDFYGDFSETALFFRYEDTRNFAKAALTKHFTRLLCASFDHDYYLAVARIGSVHLKIGLPSYVYASAYSRIVDSILAGALDMRKATSVSQMRALGRVISMDRSLTIEAFYALKIGRAEAISQDLGRLRMHLENETVE